MREREREGREKSEKKRIKFKYLTQYHLPA